MRNSSEVHEKGPKTKKEQKGESFKKIRPHPIGRRLRPQKMGRWEGREREEEKLPSPSFHHQPPPSDKLKFDFYGLVGR